MIKNNRRAGLFSGILSAIMLCGGAVSVGEEPSRNGSLNALERRALMAQALVQQVETLDQKVAELQKEIKANETTIEELRKELEQRLEKISSLEVSLAERDKKIEQQRNMLAIFRSGSFEYYEVSAGDTLESIAVQPMIYGDASRATLIKQANDLSDDAVLSSGTILIIPRYPEGVIHEL
jgi:predicted RNase H-like nuclease (RuvC/YqgF family)